MRRNVFEAFIVGDESRNNNGSALGLAISKKIILNPKGTIRLVYQPRDGYGTEFEIILPYDKGD